MRLARQPPRRRRGAFSRPRVPGGAFLGAAGLGEAAGGAAAVGGGRPRMCGG